MAPATLVARDRYRLAHAPITVDNGGEGLRTDHRMVRQMNQRAGCRGADLRQSGLDRGKLALKKVGVFDDQDSRIYRNRAAHRVGVRTDHHYQPRNALEYRGRKY